MVKEEARQEIAKLVAKYQSLDKRAIREYNEANTRRVFIEPLFSALGWDIYNREEVAEEVKAASGRVDYVFRLHGVSQFYLEAKALQADLTRPEYIKQAITYAYNKGITWAVLSDFEGLRVYNAQTGRPFIALSYENYLTDLDDLWLLSKESFQNNALNEKAEKYGALPPRLGIEQRLYNQLRQWREDLFNQLHLHNEHLSVSQIDEVIQRLFNRLIFIRNCEDRRIEDRVLLSAVSEWRGGGRKGELIERLRHIFRDFDGYYDSDLFAYHLTDEAFIESLTIENIINGLYEIPSGMASYDFSIIDADVLGAVYEQYLGHVAAIVKQRAREAQARMDLGLPIEETFEITAKKQRRKEHGIYYTPKFVTSYIVQETVGRFLNERNYDDILKIKILDPACGSGSFLIRAYDELLNYHAYRRSKSVAELDQWERLPILTNNIFGVDLDIQAVEIARLNLLLRSLARRETLPSLADNIRQGNSLISGAEEELKGYFGDNWQEKKPFNWEGEFPEAFNRDRKPKTSTITIDTNAINVKQRIKELNLLEKYERWGLVQILKTDVLDTELLTDETSCGQNRRDKASNLPEDIGIGVLGHSRLGHARLAGEEDIKLQDEIIKVLFQKTRHQLTTQQLRDAMHLHTHVMHHRDFFVTTDKHILSRKEELHKKFGINAGIPEECLQFIEGFLPKGFDVVIGNPPYMLLQPQNVSEEELRFIHAHYLSAQYKVDTFHLFLERGISLLVEDGKLGFIVPNTFLMNIYTSNLRKLILDTCKILEIVIIPRQVFPEAEVDNAILVLQKESDPAKRSENEIKCKIAAENAQLSAIFTSLQAEGTVSQRAFLTQPNYLFNISLGDTLDSIFTKADKSSWTLGELARVHFGLQTRDRRHYPDDVVVTTDRSRIAAPYQPCLTGKDIQRYAICFSNRYVYFDESIRAGGCWDKEMHLANKKIIIRQIGEYPIAAFDDEGYCCLNTAFMVKSKVPHLDLRYVLGIINSRFVRSYWRGRFFDQKVLFPKIKGAHLKQLPIRRIDFDNPAEKKLHDELVALVDRMLELNKRLTPIRNLPFTDRDELLREIERTDKEIDNLVYNLYGLTEEERKIVEGNG